jgi:hypothetical protein
MRQLSQYVTPSKESLTMNIRPLAVLAMLTLGACQFQPVSAAQSAKPRVVSGSAIESGRYLTVVGGCNDCHTKNWNETFGDVPEAERLTGTAVGWQGPWGVTYPANLRLTAASMTEDAWVTMLHTRKDRPPMPWMSLNAMAEADQRAIYRYLKFLGATGEVMPAATAPGEPPKTAFIPIAPPQAPR